MNTRKLKKVLTVVGTRPNFMKMGPMEEAWQKLPGVQHLIVHTGQHYDDNMSKEFFRDFALRTPDHHLGIEGGSLGDQTGRIMIAFERVLQQIKPNLVVVVGDVNSTFAAAWVAVQNHVTVAHVESGLRSFDRRMPEEINRICTDAISDLLFTTHPDASLELEREGVPASKIFMVGDIMIDYLVRYRQAALDRRQWDEFGVKETSYGVVTLHRPANVDDPDKLGSLADTLIKVAAKLPLIFSVHPRTKKNLRKFSLLERLEQTPNLKLCEPLSYIPFLSLILRAKLVLTDSGGIQEETTFLDVPCVTLRENTERRFCIEHGTNVLVGGEQGVILAAVEKILAGERKHARAMPGWDGQTGMRIVTILNDYLHNQNHAARQTNYARRP